jgi:hypothetical protein
VIALVEVDEVSEVSTTDRRVRAFSTISETARPGEGMLATF